MRSAHGSGSTALDGRRVGYRAHRLQTRGPAGARPGRRHNLPAPVTSFIGRAEELEAVGKHLGTTRLLTLTGVGGIGKTRLALQLASTLVDAYADGVWLVELAALDDPSLVPRAVVAALAIQPPPASSSQDPLAEAFESSELLLILDNCEHLVEAVARIADRLLRACPGLRILATSREPLGIAGETVWRVPGLGVPALPRRGPGGSPLTPSPLTEAGQLFAERAGAVRPDLVLDGQALAAVAEICRRLDGMPLAIELAAARVGVLGVVQIAARLDDRFRLLAGGNRAALPRHQTLRALVDWSFDLLSTDEQMVLRRLAVFTGGWTLEAAERVATSEPWAASRAPDRSQLTPRHSLLDVLDRLAAKSLVLAEDQGGEVRYRLLETIREYASERLEDEDERAALRDRHLAWFVALAERAETHLQGPDQAAWLTRLDTEAGNLRAALGWAQASGQIEAGLRLGRALWQFWRARGHLVEGRTWLEGLLSQTTRIERPFDQSLERLRVEAAVRAGNLSLERAEFVRARAQLEWALETARSLGSRSLAADALTQLGHAARQEHRWDEARTLYLESLGLRRELADRLGEAWALGSLGHLALAEGDLAAACACYEQGLTIARELDNPWEVATFLRLLGKQASDAGDWRTAFVRYAEGLQLFRRLGDRRGAIATLEGLAGVAAATGRAEVAIRLAGVAESERLALDAPLSPHDQVRVDRQLQPARCALGRRQSAALFAAGRTVSLDEAVEDALDIWVEDGGLDGAVSAAGPAIASARPRGSGAAVSSLTAREREVAMLVARGAGNVEISSTLTITRRTVEAHVSAILSKLGLSTRTQIAIWAVEHGL